jgi:DNA-binding HxlR family transcriptional regulator
MPGPKDLGYLECSIANSVPILGDRWNLLIIRDAFMGVRRFEDFQADLGIARNILSSRLNDLVAEGLFETVPYQDNPPRNEYRLTPKGKDLMDLLLALWRWGDKWAPPEERDPRELIHLDCGEPTHIVASCAHCGGELTRSNLRIVPGLEVLAETKAVAG